ncbi:MAG: adenylyl-sulfate kinase [Acidimicrobiales bacterium]
MTDNPRTDNTVWHPGGVDRADRWRVTGETGGLTIWLTGLSGSGKSSVAVELERQLIEAGRPAYLLDGDNLRHGLNGDLGFTAEDRDENVRRTGHVALLLCDAGIVAIVPLISPYRAARDFARSLHEAAGLPFLEVFIDTPLQECERRDPKGLYARARAGEIEGMTGIDDPYEAPLQPDRRYTPEDGEAAEVAAKLLASL